MADERGRLPRRAVFGAHVEAALRAADGGLVGLRHVVDVTRAVARDDDGWRVALRGG